jgi:hypothetical protein
MRKTLHTLGFCAIFALTAKSQVTSISLDVPTIVPITPTAAALDKYQSYPVDHSSGVPKIVIPLYEIVSGELTIPVTLSYHASGLKPKDGSTLAGTGWTLNLEPSVTRQILGAPDESYYGWFNDPGKDYNPSSEASKIQYYGQLVDGSRDTQPDRFSYTLASSGGKGYFANRFRFLSIPRNSDKVEYNDGNGLAVTDGKGIKYIFKDTEEKSGDITTRWLCKSIWSPNNSNRPLAEFTYLTDRNTLPPSRYYNLDNKAIVGFMTYGLTLKNIFTVQTTNQNRHYSIEYPSGPVTGIPDANLRSVSESEARVNYPLKSTYIGVDWTLARLGEVTFMGNRLSVSYTAVGTVPNNRNVFDEITVKDKDGTTIRTIKFHITPYNSATSLMKLDSVVISAPGTESRKFAFVYNDPYNVPSVYTVSVDHWGFCNGAENRSEPTVPSFRTFFTLPDVNGGTAKSVAVNFSGAYREPDHSWTQKGVLTRITNEQGITTDFMYEGNFGAFRNNSKTYGKDFLYPVGGLRVKRIEVRDPRTTKALYTDYKYGLTKPEVVGYTPIWGGGAIKHIVTIRNYSSSVKQRTSTGIPATYNYLTTYSSMPEGNITFNGGSAVMYNIVSEETTNSSDNVVMKKSYYYNVNAHNFEDVLNWNDSDPAGSVQAFLREQPASVLQQLVRPANGNPREPLDELVGHYAMSNQSYGSPQRTETFRGNNIVASSKYAYTPLRTWGNNIAVDIPARLIIGETTGLTASEVFSIGNYLPGSSSGKPQTTYYLDVEFGNSLTKETESRFFTISGATNEVVSEKRYGYQYESISPTSSLAPRRIEMTGSNGTLVIDSLDYHPSFPAMLSRSKHIESSSWKESRVLFRPNSNLPAKVQSRSNQSPSFKDEVNYNAYDMYGNVTEITGKDGIPVSYVWGYQGQFPVAKIENASIQQVYNGTTVFDGWAADPEPSVALWARIDQLRTQLPAARITKFEYKPLQGVISITDPNNMTTKFDYDHYGRLTDSYFMDVKSPTDIRRTVLQKYIYRLGK